MNAPHTTLSREDTSPTWNEGKSNQRSGVVVLQDLFTMTKNTAPGTEVPSAMRFLAELWRSRHPKTPKIGGGERIRTDDPLLAKQALSH